MLVIPRSPAKRRTAEAQGPSKASATWVGARDRAQLVILAYQNGLVES